MENTQVEKINSSNRIKKTLSMCILGLFLFLILILVYEYFRIVPENVRFTNITSTSVTVSWNTKNPISATAVYKKGDGGFINLFGIGKQVFYDTRDLVKAELKAVEQTSKNIAKSDDISVSMSEVKTEVKVTDKGKYYTHHVEIRGLDPETEYSFFVGDDLLYRAIKDVDGNTTVKTAKIAESVKTPVPAYSSVKDAQNKEEIKYSDLTPVNDGVVYVNYLDDLTGNASNQFSAVLNENGNWYADLSTAVDSEGNLFLEKYDTEAKNLKIIITLNAGPLGIWRQWQNAYTIAPAQEIVINMANGVTDGSIEGSVIKLSQSDDTKNEDVKGVMAATCRCECLKNSDGTIKYSCPSGYDFNCDADWSCTTVSSVCTKYDSCTTEYCGTQSGPTCYKGVSKIAECPSCTPTCPSGFDWQCPSGKECTTIRSSCTPQYNGKPCGPKKEGDSCYKVKETPPPQTCKGRIVSPYATKSSCIYYLSFSCSAPCFYVDGCDSGGDPHYVRCENDFCDNTGIPGLDCRREPPDENAFCPGSNIKVNQYGMFNGECKKCEWKVVDSRYGGYGLGLTNVDSDYCSSDPKCGSNNNRSFEAGTVLTLNLCSSGTPDPSTIHIIEGNNKWSCKLGTKTVQCSATGKTPNQPEDPDACQKGNIKGQLVCNGTEYVELGSLCEMNEENGVWNDDGNCYVASEDPELQEDPISEISPELYCWTHNFTDFYSYQNVNGKMVMYQCLNNKLTEIDNFGTVKNANNCLAFASGGANTCDSPSFFSPRNNAYCVSKGVIYYCKNGEWVKAEDIGKDDDIQVGQIAIINPGEVCTNLGTNIRCECSDSGNIVRFGQWCETERSEINPGEMCMHIPLCSCSSGPDKNIPKLAGNYCRTTSNCKEYYDNCVGSSTDDQKKIEECKQDLAKQVCSNNGKTCTYGTWECTGNPPIQNLIPNNTINNTLSINKPIINLNDFKVSAQPKNINSQYVIDQKTGMFVNLPQGEYIFEYEGQQYYFEVTDPYGNKRVFIDKGLDGKYDEGTDILVSDLASIVQVEPIELRYTYVLKQGFNFVSFPFLVSNQEYRTAAGLLKRLNDVYKDTIYSIAKYDGSWKVVGQNEELYSANDFQLLPGQGYVIKAKDDVTIDIWGKPIKYDNDSPNAPVALFKGWNLVGLYGTGIKQYTAKTLLEDINKYEKVDFSADNVSKWDNELQRYEGFQIADKNGVPTEYGFDYLINLLNSYFVRVQDGEGNWQPELAQ